MLYVAADYLIIDMQKYFNILTCANYFICFTTCFYHFFSNIMLNKKNNASALTPLPVTAHRSPFRRLNLKTIFFTQFTGEKKTVLPYPRIGQYS